MESETTSVLGSSSGSESEGKAAASQSSSAAVKGPVIEQARGKFFVSIVGRSRVRSLHRHGECYRRPGIHYRTFEELGDSWPSKNYHRVCKACFPKQLDAEHEDEQSSDSDDSEVSSSDSQSGD